MGQSLNPSSQGRRRGVKLTDAAGVFTVPSGVSALWCLLVGGGGGGGLGQIVAYGGGGGGVVNEWLNVQGGQQIPYVIGAGGIGGACTGLRMTTAPTAGGATTFDALSAPGGWPGYVGYTDGNGVVQFLLQTPLGTFTTAPATVAGYPAVYRGGVAGNYLGGRGGSDGSTAGPGYLGYAGGGGARADSGGSTSAEPGWGGGTWGRWSPADSLWFASTPGVPNTGGGGGGQSYQSGVASTSVSTASGGGSGVIVLEWTA